MNERRATEDGVKGTPSESSLRETFAKFVEIFHPDRWPRRKLFTEADLAMIARAVERVESIPHQKTRIDFERSVELDIRELKDWKDLTRISPALRKACDALKLYARNIDVCIERNVHSQLYQAALVGADDMVDDLIQSGYSIDLKSPDTRETLVELLAKEINGFHGKALLPMYRKGLHAILAAGATVPEAVVTAAQDPEARALLEAAYLRQVRQENAVPRPRINRGGGL